MEFCEGGKVDDVEYMKQHGIEVDDVSQIKLKIRLSSVKETISLYIQIFVIKTENKMYDSS